MPDSPVANSAEEPAAESPSPPAPAPDEVLTFEVPAEEENASSPQDPKIEKALQVLGEVFARRTRREQDEEQRLLADEAFVIREAASQLTGTSLLSGPGDKFLLIAHHLKDFFAALPLPPGLDPETRACLRREALTMLLKLRPQDDMERMILMQMIASHMASMTCFARVAAPDTPPELAAQSLGLAQKMSRLCLDIERAIRARRKDLGVPKSPEAPIDPKMIAERILGLLECHGITFDDDDASP